MIAAVRRPSHLVIHLLATTALGAVAFCAPALLPGAGDRAWAADYGVTSAEDDGSGTTTGTLSYALTNAVAGDTITIASSVTSIEVTGSLPDISAGITITSDHTVTITGASLNGATGGSLVLTVTGSPSTDAITTGLSGTFAGTSGTSGSGSAVPGNAGGSALSGTGFVVTSSASLTGGAGGTGGTGAANNSGGSGIGYNGGTGGTGGAAVSGSYFFLTNSGDITGGAGGAGGDGGSGFTAGGDGGAGGTGGAGVLGDHFTLVNLTGATISGGAGGTGGTGASGPSDGATGTSGSGGVGVYGSDITLVNAGTISGGLSSDGTTRANAIEFTDGANSLELQAGYDIIGDVVATAGSDDTLILGGSDDASFDLSAIGEQYTGFETFSKTGSSTWTVTGTTSSANFDTVSISEGTLLVDGTLGGSLSVGGGILGGTGTVGDVTVSPAGTISPGTTGTIGTLTVDGDLTFESGSTYAVDVTASAADLISVTGTADVSGGAVSVTSLDAETSYQTSQTYTILTADTVSGSFAETVSNSAFLDVTTETVDNSVKLTVSIKSNADDDDNGSGVFTTVANTDNQYAVSSALDTLEQSGDSLSLYNDLLVMSADEAREAYDQLSGDAYAGQHAAMMQNAGAVNAAINNRVRSAFDGTATAALTTGSIQPLGYAEEKPADPDSPFASYEAKKTARIADPDRFAIWGSGFGSWGSSDGLDGASGTDTSTGGFLIGADGMISETWRAGIFAGHSASNFDTDSSSGDSDNYHVGAYAGTEIGQFSIRSGLSYTWYAVDTTRVVSALGQTLDGSYDSTSLNAFGELGYRFNLSDTAFEPFAGIAYTHMKTDGFSESGGTAALTVDGATMDTTYTTLGMRASRNLELGGIITVARGTLGWQHAFGDVDPTSTARFATGDSFTVSSTPIDEDVALIEAGLDFRLDNGATIGIGYSGQFGRNATENGFNAKLRVQF